MKSVWQETSLPKFPRLEDDIKTDVLIIGGGLAGVLTAYFLHQNGIPYVLVEKNRICQGNTQHTTAKITVQHGLIYSQLVKSGGTATAQKYLWANSEAFDRYAELCQSIPCDYEIKDNYVFSTDRNKLENEMRALQKIGVSVEFCESLPLPVSTAGAVKFPRQAQFHPLKFVSGLAKDLNIYENTFVREMVGNTAVTDQGRIQARRVICATHFPFINKHGFYFLKLYQSRSYVIALENAQDVNGMYVDEDDKGYSFRNYENLLLLGGGGSRTGKNNAGWSNLRSFAGEHYPNARKKYAWAAQDCMSLDGIPYIGAYSGRTRNFYVETGFNKWGMTGSMLSAMLITDELLGRRHDYADIFNPSRSVLHLQLLVNSAEAVAHLLIPTRHVCPHMGCALQWNQAEHTWDCPCHGSRFTSRGELIDNPANGDLPPGRL